MISRFPSASVPWFPCVARFPSIPRFPGVSYFTRFLYRFPSVPCVPRFEWFPKVFPDFPDFIVLSDFLVFRDFPVFLYFAAFPGFHDFPVFPNFHVFPMFPDFPVFPDFLVFQISLDFFTWFFTRFLYKEGNPSTRNQNIMKKELLMLGNQFKMPKSYHFSNKCMSLCITLWFVKSLWGCLFGIVAYWEGLGQWILKDK